VGFEFYNDFLLLEVHVQGLTSTRGVVYFSQQGNCTGPSDRQMIQAETMVTTLHSYDVHV